MAWLNTLRLKSSNPQIRCKAVENLAGSTSKSDTERIFASLYDQSPQVRCAAVRALEKTKDNDSVSSLIGALRDECFEVREAAARSLGRMGNVTAASHLAVSLKDADGAVRVAAACALRAIGWKPSTREELARFEIALGKTPVTISAGSAALDPLMADHKHDTTFQRREAADALRELNDPSYFRPVLAGLADPDPGNRIATIHSLGQVTHPEVTAEILKCFRDNDADVRLAAAQMLSGRDDPSPVHFLGLLDDTNFEVRLAAVQFLGRIRNPQIAQVLIPVLADASVDVRQATAAALGRIGHASAIEGLVMCLTDEDRLVRQAAEQALQDIDPNWMRTDSASNACGRLEVLLSVSAPWERLAIQQVLEKLRGPTPGNQPADQTETQASVRV